jgi:glycosyltransferase involved in cell wall biosynthesis
VFADHVTRAWVEAGHEVTMFTSASPGLADEEVDEAGRRVVRAGGRFSVYREARRWASTNGGFDAIVDVVNTRPFLAPAWATGTPVAALIYQVAREVWSYEVPRPAALLGRHVLEPRWLRQYSGVPTVTISESSASDLASYGLRDVTIVRPGLGVAVEAAPEKAPRPLLVFTGRLSANKRPGDALRAFELVRAQVPDVEMVVIGDGPLAPALRTSHPDARFLGFVDEQEKRRQVARASLLLVSSVLEGWGMVVTEAAAAGTMAVGYDVGGLRESIRAAGGELCAPSPEAMAEVAVRVLRSGRHRMYTPTSSGLETWGDTAGRIMAVVERARRAPVEARG